ncbi:MAG: hypothetical protein KI793_34710 [Rivularia sp. (in: Bacteria)]|nr:hypothetical protein [Rivularia sp. MS3]
MTTKSIKPGRLIRDSLITVIPIYRLLLVFYIPRLILYLLKFVIPNILLSNILDQLYSLSIGSIFGGAALFFSYKKINKEKTTIDQALQKAIKKFSELLLLSIILSLLFIPDFIPRLWFVLYAVMIEDYSIADAFKRSWQLTKGYGWQIFRSILIVKSILWVLIFLPSLISASTFGISVWDINRGELLTNNPAFIFNRLLTICINLFVYNPFMTMYQVLMFVRLLALEKRKLDSVAT